MEIGPEPCVRRQRPTRPPAVHSACPRWSGVSATTCVGTWELTPSDSSGPTCGRRSSEEQDAVQPRSYCWPCRSPSQGASCSRVSQIARCAADGSSPPPSSQQPAGCALPSSPASARSSRSSLLRRRSDGVRGRDVQDLDTRLRSHAQQSHRARDESRVCADRAAGFPLLTRHWPASARGSCSPSSAVPKPQQP